MQRSILIFGFVMYLLMVKSEVVITNTVAIGHEVPVTLTFEDTENPGKRAKISVSLSASQIEADTKFPIACFPNDVDNVIAEGATVDGFTMMYAANTFAASTPAAINFYFLKSTITMGDDSYFDYDLEAAPLMYLNTISPDVTWTGGVLSHFFEVNDTFSDPIALDSSMTAAICIFGNDLTVDIGQDEWGNVAEENINQNQYATFVYWTAPSTQTTEEESSSGIQAVAKVGIFALGALAWII